MTTSSPTNLLSPDLDARRALQAVSVELPCPSAPTLSNLAEYASRSTSHGRRPTSSRTVAAADAAVTRNAAAADRQQLVKFVEGPRRAAKNVLTIMETIGGPMARLRQCMDDKTRVKVWTRRHTEVRGVCCGRILAFDRHWNIVMADVDESYVLRAPNTKIPAAITSSTCSPSASFSAMTGAGLQRRHVSQLFVRGDNVAFVSIPSSS